MTKSATIRGHKVEIVKNGPDYIQKIDGIAVSCVGRTVTAAWTHLLRVLDQRFPADQHDPYDSHCACETCERSAARRLHGTRPSRRKGSY